jgi:hypothetical protein
MNYIRVRSSKIKAVGYEQDSQTLGVCFQGGGEYHYSGVPQRVYDDLLFASSVGQYFDRYVKNAGYPCRKIR